MHPSNKFNLHYLNEVWQHFDNLRHNRKNVFTLEWKYINAVFNTLGIGIEPTIKFLMNECTSFNQFENWIEQNGRISYPIINYFNTAIQNEKKSNEESIDQVFNATDLKQWNDNGYVILEAAIPKEDCDLTIKYICDKLNINLEDPISWYNHHPLKQGIMIQLFNSHILDKNRLNIRVRKAFEQLWGRQHLMVSMDRVSFNPPETEYYQFQGPNLHWDVSLKTPIPFGIQGLLYLNDVDENQGAFTVIPGFHNKIEAWLDRINDHPREINLLDHFKEKPIAAYAGDLIIWNHCLPHGSRPNTSDYPRFVQYINYQPLDLEYQKEWI